MSSEIGGVKVYTVKEVAGLLNIHPHTVRKYIKAGYIKGGQIGRGFLVSDESIEDYLRLVGITKETHGLSYFNQ